MTWTVDYKYNGILVPLDPINGMPKVGIRQFWRVTEKDYGFELHLMSYHEANEYIPDPSLYGMSTMPATFAYKTKKVRKEETIRSVTMDTLREVDILSAACYIYSKEQMVNRSLLGTYGDDGTNSGSNVLQIPED